MQVGRAGIDGFADDIRRQRRYVGQRVPAYDRVLALVAGELDGELGRRLTKAWAKRSFDIYYDRPLLLLATLRHDALETGPAHPLWPALAAEVPDPSTVTPAALGRAFARDRPRVWHSLTRRSVQTNEVSRSVAWLWPAALAGADARDLEEAGARAARPLVLCDLGCSAGLNLVADSLALTWTEPGPPRRPLAVARAPRVTRRLGFDRDPLDATDDDAAAWLRACVWAGERDRLDRLERALAAFRAATAATAAAPPAIERIDARDMPDRLAALAAADDSGALWLAFQTLVREYLGPARDAYLAGMQRWVSSMPAGRALWIELEDPPHGATRERPAAIIAHFRARDGRPVDRVLGRCQYHPEEVAPEPEAVAELAAAFPPG